MQKYDLDTKKVTKVQKNMAKVLSMWLRYLVI